MIGKLVRERIVLRSHIPPVTSSAAISSGAITTNVAIAGTMAALTAVVVISMLLLVIIAVLIALKCRVSLLSLRIFAYRWLMWVQSVNFDRTLILGKVMFVVLILLIHSNAY